MKKLILFFSLIIAAGLTAINAQGTWSQKADVPGGGRAWWPISFSIGNFGYVGLGLGNGTGIAGKDLWQYDPTTDTWSQKADYPNFTCAGVHGAVAFSISNKAYIGTGNDNCSLFDSFFEYDPVANTWAQKASFAGGPRAFAVGFSIGNKGYISTGFYSFDSQPPTFFNDLWEYDPTLDSWTRKADFPGQPRRWAVGFSIGNKGYVGTGEEDIEIDTGLYTSISFSDFWGYDPALDSWTQIANFSGGARNGAVGFGIGSKGYTGTGNAGKDFWEYDPSTNIWTQKADVGIDGRYMGTGFSLNGKGYIAAGITMNSYRSDFWEYTPEVEITCSVPTGLTTANITGTSAKLNWDDVDGALGYVVRYKTDGDPKWTMKTATTSAKNISGLSPNTKYTWSVRTFCSVKDPIISSAWALKQTFTTGAFKLADELSTSFDVYPNPFESSTTISFSVAEDSRVQISLYDVAGKLMQTVLNENVSAGDHAVTLDRNQLIAGIYLLKLQVNDQVIVRKVVVE